MKYFTKLLWACVLILGLTVSSVSDVGIGTDTPRTGIFPLLDTGIVTTGLGTQFGYDAESAGPYGSTAIAHPTNNEGTVERDSAAAYWDPDDDILKYARGTRENIWLTSEPTSCTGFTCGNVTVDAFAWPYWDEVLYPTHAVIFGDNSIVRNFYFDQVLSIGDWYVLSLYVKMDDDSVPNPGPGASGYDFYFSIGGNGVTSNFTITHVGSNVYRISGYKKISTAGSSNGILKWTNQSSKGFKVSGFQLERTEGPISSPGDERASNIDFSGINFAQEAKYITGITSANPGVITFASGHGYSDGNYLYVSGLTEMTELNGKFISVYQVSGDTYNFHVADAQTSSNFHDTSGYAAETTGGPCAVKVDLTDWDEQASWGPVGTIALGSELMPDNNAVSDWGTEVDSTSGYIEVNDPLVFESSSTDPAVGSYHFRVDTWGGGSRGFMKTGLTIGVGWYVLEFMHKKISGVDTYLSFYTGDSGLGEYNYFTNYTSWTRHRLYFYNSIAGTQGEIRIRGNGSSEFYIDDLSYKPLTYSNGKAHVDGEQVSSAYMRQTDKVLPRKFYLVDGTISNWVENGSADYISFGFDDPSQNAYYANGTYDDVILENESDSNTAAYIWGGADAIATVDDVSWQEITLPGGVEPGPYTKTTGSALPIPAEARIEIVGHNGSNPTYNASGDKKWLLMEPEACNECLYSREFDESVWTLSGTGSRTQNEKGIDGVSNIAWTLTDSDGAVLVRDQQSISIVSGTDAYTVSAFIKKTVGASTFPVLGVRILNGTTEIESYIILNTNSGATAEASAVGGGADAYGAISYGANWWRVWIIVDDNNTGNDLFHIWLCPAGSDDGSTIDVSLTGSVVFDQIDMRFVQRWVDSPIPTTTSSVCRATDAENPYWGSISGLFDATGTLVARWRPGFNEDNVSSDSAIFSVQDNAVSIAYHDASTNGLASNDGTTNATVSLDFSAFDDYRLAVKWGYDSGPEHFRIGADLFSNAFGSGDWGTEQSFDSAYAEGSYLKIGYDIIAPFHIQFIRIFNKILSDSQIDEL